MAGDMVRWGGLRALGRICVLLAAVALAGCSSLTPATVSPTLDSKAVIIAVGNRTSLMAALQQDAAALGFGGGDWYEVALAGYNYVDDQCAVYFNSLFAFNRRTAAVRSGLTAFDKTSAAIMEITGVASVTMSAVAQAFGLAGAMTDVVAGTFLYDLPPANTQRFVQKTMGAYKDAAANHRQSIRSPASAYSSIRGYLDLCLPVTIEGQLIDRISDMKPESRVNSIGPNIEIDVRPSASAPGLRLPDSAAAPFDRPAPPHLPTTYEKIVSVAEWVAIQRLLCVEIDGRIGPATRKAMADFYNGRKTPRGDIPEDGVTEVDVRYFKDLVDLSGGKSCAERGVQNAFQVGELSRGN
jgi:hypothetical protein